MGDGCHLCTKRSNLPKQVAPHFLISRCQQVNIQEVGAGEGLGAKGQGQIYFFLCIFPQAPPLPESLSFFFFNLVNIC